MADQTVHDVLIIGGGLAGLSAAIYLGRALRDVLLVSCGRSMAVWEPDAQNYLGFPEGIAGEELVARGREQAERYGTAWVEDEILALEGAIGRFVATGRNGTYRAKRVLLAVGIYHIPPDIPAVGDCLGTSMFFCKDCDGWRVRGKRVAIVGNRDDAAEYALAMLPYSPRVVILTNGERGFWDEQHARWLAEHEIPVLQGRITEIEHEDGQITAIGCEGQRHVAIDALFATRGDLFRHGLAKGLGAALDGENQVVVDADGRTSVPGLFAAGCITPANCQMIIAAGSGATAAQAINRELFEESLRTGSLQRYRAVQLQREETAPEILE